MKFVEVALATVLACLMPSPASAQSADAELESAMRAARWTGPLLASNAETLPQGHFYTEPYFFDGISGGEHSPGTSGFYQYGLADNLTIGMQPFFSLGTHKYNHDLAIGDFKLLSQLRLSHFTPQHQVPSIALVMNLVLPTGKDDKLSGVEEGQGSGAFAPEIGINVQQYFLLENGRLLRARINLVERVPLRTAVSGRSVYGTLPGFQGHAKPGAKSTVIVGTEYSLTNKWVLAFDLEADHWDKTLVTGRYADGAPVRQVSPVSWNIGFAPAVEYNWSASAGAILGVWIVPKGHNTPSSVTPAIAIQRFW